MSRDPEWLVRPTSRAWNLLLDHRPAHRSLFRVTQNAAEMIAPPLNGEPGIFSDDPRFVRVQQALGELTRDFPASTDEQGFAGPNGVIADFYSLRNRSGYYMNPTTVPMMSNEEVVRSLNLASGFLSERDERIFTALHHYMFRTIEPATMGIRKTASSGAPHFTAQVDAKKSALMTMNEYSGDILARFAQGELEGLYEDYQLMFATYMGVRTQPDAVLRDGDTFKAKDREVNDELYSRSGGREGSRGPADKLVRDADGRVVPGIFAMRRRAVYAYPAMYNYWLTQFFTPLRAFYLRDAEFTFKHREPATIISKLEPYISVRGFDVKQFDQSVAPWLLEQFVAKFAGFIKEEVLFFLGSVLRQPIYVPHPGVGAKFKFNPCYGDPFDLSSFTLDVGLPSGIGPNPDIGKFLMTFTYLCLLDRHFHDVLEIGVPTILRGKHDRYALLDMGDDAVLGVNDESFWVTADRVTKEQFYFRLEKEDGISFLGNVLYKDRAGQRRACPNIVTFLRNRLCPEHGVQHWSRRDFAGTGWFEGKKHYSSAPTFGDVWAQTDDIWREHFGEGLDTRFYALREAERRRGVPSLDAADIAVREDPDKLYYRFDITEIHPWVVDKIIGSIPFETYFPHIERYFL